MVFVHYDIFVLAGNLRAMLMLADLARYLGYRVTFLYSDIRPPDSWYWRPGELKAYHPVKYLEFPSCVPEPGTRCGDFVMENWRYIHIRLHDWMVYDFEQYDVYVTDEPRLLWVGSCCPAMTGVYYVHYPDRPRAPKKGRVYVFNSSYTADLAAYWWHLRGHILWPPLWLDMYKSREWDDRDIDVIFFGQMYRVKGFNLAKKLAEMGYRVAVVGAWVSDWIPDDDRILVRPNATFTEYRDLLSRSKVYVHARPGEHFGITITEAMASGTPAIVHRSGGQWMDIAANGRYAMGWSTIEELVRKLQLLAKHRRVWESWHIKALERSTAFDARRLQWKWKMILETASRVRRRAIT